MDLYLLAKSITVQSDSEKSYFITNFLRTQILQGISAQTPGYLCSNTSVVVKLNLIRKTRIYNEIVRYSTWKYSKET